MCCRLFELSSCRGVEASSQCTVQYLFNGSRWASRNPSECVGYGTTGCEATHASLRKFFDTATQKSNRYACALTTVFGIRMVLSGFLRRLPLTKDAHHNELLANAVAVLRSMPFVVDAHVGNYPDPPRASCY